MKNARSKVRALKRLAEFKRCAEAEPLEVVVNIALAPGATPHESSTTTRDGIVVTTRGVATPTPSPKEPA